MRGGYKMNDTYCKAGVGYERIQEILQTENEVRDLRGAHPIKTLKGKIEFEHVSFSYTPEQPILRDMSFSIEPGRVAALVGPTGVGKTTIVSLVSRFYDPTQAAVKIDGTIIRRFKQQSLREHISYVLHDNMLIHGPLWRNIAYGRLEMTAEEIISTAVMAY